MKKLLLLLFASILCFQSYGQGLYELSLAKEVLPLTDRKFYIASVMDYRTDKSNIGVFRLGLLDSSRPVILKGGLSVSLQKYFDFALPKEGVMIPISIKVRVLKIAQWRTNNNEMASVDLALDYYSQNDLVFSSKKNLVVTDEDVIQRHEGNIRDALKMSILEFSKCDWLAKMDSEAVLALSKGLVPVPVVEESMAGSIQFKPEVVKEEIAYGENRNITTFGYQIGGYSMIGMDYEVRLSNSMGLHAGLGYLGYTYGLMVHTNAKKNSPYFNFSFKDGGLGVLQVAAVEYGGRLVMNKRSGFGLTFQIGIAKVLKMNDAFKDLMYKGASPEFMPSMGIGFSW